MFAPHLRLTALGRLGTSEERFSYGINLGVSGAGGGVLPTPNESNAALFAACAEAVRAFHARPASQIASTAILEVVKFAEITPDGGYGSDPYTVDVTDTPGGTVDPTAVAYTKAHDATAISLVTARRGPTGKGRFYAPVSTTSVGTDFLMPTNFAESIRDSAATMLSALNAAMNSAGDLGAVQVIVASSKGYNTPVTGVRVGRRPDVIQSRARALPETYVAVAAVSQ